MKAFFKSNMPGYFPNTCGVGRISYQTDPKKCYVSMQFTNIDGETATPVYSMFNKTALQVGIHLIEYAIINVLANGKPRLKRK